MGLILDTIIYSDIVFEQYKLNDDTKNFIAEQKDLYITIPTLWELSNHVRKGTYQIDLPFDEYFKLVNKNLDIKVLPMSWAAMNWLSVTPYITAFEKPHKDTFDRMIIAHAIVNNLPIISKDNAFPFYESVGLISCHVRY